MPAEPGRCSIALFPRTAWGRKNARRESRGLFRLAETADFRRGYNEGHADGRASGWVAGLIAGGSVSGLVVGAVAAWW
jgi:hypothetical protein